MLLTCYNMINQQSYKIQFANRCYNTLSFVVLSLYVQHWGTWGMLVYKKTL